MVCPFCHAELSIKSEVMESTPYWGDHAHSVTCPKCRAGGFEVDGVVISMLVATAPTENSGNGEHILQQPRPKTAEVG